MLDRNTLKSALAATPECLTAEQLALLLDSKQTDPHLAGCVRCQTELVMLKSFEMGAPLPNEGAAVAWVSAHLDRQLETIKDPSRRRLLRATQGIEPQRSWMAQIFAFKGIRWAMPAVAVAAIAIVSAVLLKPARQPELQANAGGNSAIYRSQEVKLISPVGEVQEVPHELRWQVFAGAVTYKVVLMEVDHSQLWTSETKEESVFIPGAVRAKILTGKPILWQVTARDAQLRVIASSQLQRFISADAHSSTHPLSSQE
jgi:hypothetical protein